MSHPELVKGIGVIYEIATCTRLELNKYDYKTGSCRITHEEIDKDLDLNDHNDFTTIEIHQYKYGRNLHWQYSISRVAEQTIESNYYDTFEEAQSDAFKHTAESHALDLETKLISEITRRVKC